MYRNATHAFQDGLAKILKEGQIINVRGQEVKEIRSHLIRVANPLERVYVLPERKNSIFTAVAETIWVIAGRNDMAFLSYYLPRAVEFSDDGQVWRAGYGPRLRNWQGVDQIKEIVRLFNEDRNTRRAVAILFDPSADFISSKDIPCNNWLHFIVRDGQLHMNAVIRSNDAIWGFSGINTFEWSVLHEMMAYWTGSAVGDFSFFIASFHLYSRHYGRAQKIIASAKEKTLYDFGFTNSPFQTPLEAFDETLTRWFEIEARIRNGSIKSLDELESITDSFLRNCLQILYVYTRYQKGDSPQEISELISLLPSNDFKIAVVEYFLRYSEYRDLIKLSPQEQRFFDNFAAVTTSENIAGREYTFREVAELLSVLHYKKTLVYKDSWKKRGEVLGVFANISRKYDRIESILIDRATATSDESLVDTVADLAIYASKYLTYLAEHYPPMFADFISTYESIKPIESYADNLNGFNLVADVLTERYSLADTWVQADSYAKCFQLISQCYTGLEKLLINEDWRAANPLKCALSADLAITSMHYLVLLARTNPEDFRKFAGFVEML